MTGEVPEPSTYTLWVGIVSALAVVISKRFRISNEGQQYGFTINFL